MTTAVATSSREGTRGLAVVGAAGLAVAAALGAATAQAPLLVIGVLVLAGVGAVALRVAHGPVVVVLGLLYGNVAAVAVRSHGAPSAIALAVPLLLALPVAQHVVARGEPLRLGRAMPWLAGLLVVQLVSAVGSHDARAALGDVVTYLVEGLLLVFLITNAIRTKVALRRALWAVVAVSAAIGALSVFQSVTGTYDADYAGFAVVDGRNERAPDAPPRAAGSIGEQNRYAQVMLVALPLAIVLARRARGAGRALSIAAIYLVGAGLALTLSRGGAVGFVVVMGFLAATSMVSRRAIVIVAVSAGVAVLSVPEYRDRIGSLAAITEATTEEGVASDADGSLRSRATENLAAVLAFADHPVLGVGPGLFRTVYPEYAREVGFKVRDSEREAHNLYLQVLAETGLAGGVAVAGVLVTTVAGLARVRRRAGDQELIELVRGLQAAVLAYLTTAMFLHLSYQRYFWLLLALALVPPALPSGRSGARAAQHRTDGAGQDPRVAAE